MTDPFGTLWSNAYGHPFSGDQLIETSAFVEGDFTCLNPSQIKSGGGTITNISGDTITINNYNDQTINIKIGACSRIEASTAIPKVGQTLIYKGIIRD